MAFLTDAEYEQRDLGYRRRIRALRMGIIRRELEQMAEDGWPDPAAGDALIAEYEHLQLARTP